MDLKLLTRSVNQSQTCGAIITASEAMNHEHSSASEDTYRPQAPAESTEISNVLELICELKDITLSRSSFQQAETLIAELGGRERLGCTVLVVE
jgi:hypothetical protein